LERTQHIAFDVAGFLDTDRETNQRGVDSDRSERFVLELEEAHDRGLLDEGLYAAEARRDDCESKSVDHAARRSPTSFDGKAYDAAETPHLPARDRVVGVGFETGMKDALDARVALEHAGDAERGLVLSLDAQRKCLQPASHQHGRMRIANAPEHASRVP